MQLIIDQTAELLLYAAYGFWSAIGDQRQSNKSLIFGSPVPILIIVGAYLYFVRVLGPQWMKSRQPYDLKWSIRAYNIMMSLINFYCFYRVAVLTKFGSAFFGCKKQNTSTTGAGDEELIYVGYLYFSTKLMELLDTVFFILRKKYNQASGLHVFHHSAIVIIVWLYVKIAPTGSSVLFPFLNLGVHTIMYGYYFLATFEGMRESLWWKRYLTDIQLCQFILSMIHFAYQGLSDCQYSPALAIIGFVFNFVFFCLFCNFYYHAYLKTKTSIEQRKENGLSANTLTRKVK